MKRFTDKVVLVTSGYNADTVDELINRTRQAIMANFDPEYKQ